MPQVVVSKGSELKKTLENGLETLAVPNAPHKQESKTESPSALLLIDVKTPEAYPSSTNPLVLAITIDHLKSKGYETIYVMPGSMWGVDRKRALQYLGLDVLIRKKGAKILTPSELQAPYTKSQSADMKEESESKHEIKQEERSIIGINPETIDFFAILSQIRSDPKLTLWTSYANLAFLRDPRAFWVNDQNNSSTGIFSRWFEESNFILQNLKPNLVINDCFNVLSGAGPFTQTQSVSLPLHTIVLSSDLLSADWSTFSTFDLEPSSSFFLSKVRKNTGEGNGANEDRFTFDPKNIKIKNIQMGKFKEDSSSIEIPPYDPTKLQLHGLEMYVGKCDEGTKYFLVQFLYRLKSLFYKDGYNLGKWAILAGQNPPHPPTEDEYFEEHKQKTYVIFGDKTIEAVKDYDFRKIVKRKNALSGDELEKEILSKYADIRKKMRKVKEDFELTLDQLIKEKKDPKYREVTKLEEELKTEKKLAKYRYKMKKSRIKLKAKHKKRSLQNEIPKIKPNQNVISVFGNPPLPYDFFSPLVEHWPSSEVPTLKFFCDVAQEYFEFSPYDKKQRKKDWKLFKEQIESEIEALFKPKEPEIDRKIDEVKNHKKQKLEELKNDYEKEIQTLEKTYKEKIAQGEINYEKSTQEEN